MPPKSLVLLFHAVGTPAETGYKDAVSVDALNRALDWLQTNYQVVPLDRLAEERRADRSIAGLAALTFDDNHRSIAEIALPLAVARGLPATWFLMTDPLFGRPYWRRQVSALIAAGQEEAFRAYLAERAPDLLRQLRPGRLYKDSKDPSRVSPDAVAAQLAAFRGGLDDGAGFVTPGEVAALALPGLALGNHSRRHLVMAGLSPDRQREEVAAAAETLSSFPQQRSRLFAVPFGGPETYDAATLDAVAAAGLSGLAVTTSGLAAADDVSGHPLLSADSALVRSLPAALGGLAAPPMS